MNFDYTYILLFGFKVFEPMVFLINGIFFILSILFFNTLKKFTSYSRHMGLFMIMLGASMLVGAIGHAVHLQLGEVFFKIILFVMNALSLLSIYFCFLGSYSYYIRYKKQEPAKKYINMVRVWLVLLLIVCGIYGNFTVIKIHAGIVLVYSLIAHYLVYKTTRNKGAQLVITGILVSFLPIIAHSLKLSLHEWFNYKDLAHLIMIISLIIIYLGVKRISENSLTR